MLEIRPARAVIVLCLGDARAWSAVRPRLGAVCQIAPDERWVVGPARFAGELVAWARERAQAIGAPAFAIDVTDAWTVWSVSGIGIDELWARLSENPVPPGRPAFVQGAVASMPAKAIVQDGCVHFFVPSPLGHHLPQRIQEAGVDLGPQVAAPADLAIDAAAVAPLGTVASTVLGVRA